jgi:hypothetical protein
MDNNYTALECNNDNNDLALVEIGEVRTALSSIGIRVILSMTHTSFSHLDGTGLLDEAHHRTDERSFSEVTIGSNP